MTDLLMKSINMKFLWLDENYRDFEGVRQSFCRRNITIEDNWIYFNMKETCFNFIRQIDFKQKLILVTSGRFAIDIIHHLHNLPQIHSIYIYCHKKDKYESFKSTYNKIRGIFDNPIELDDRMYHYLENEIQRQLCLEIQNEPLSILRSIRLHCLLKNKLQSYYIPDISWCIWETNNCTRSLPMKGQGTIEIWLRESIPFELCISNKQILNDNNTDTFQIILKVDTRQAQLSVKNNNQQDSTIELHEILQINNNQWYCYWLTFYSIERIVQYGIGEIRPKFKILELNLNETERTSLANINYLHIKLNNSIDINTMENFKDKLKIFIGKEPIIFDPPLIIISPNEFSPTCPINYYGILADLLPNQLRNIYNQIINFIFDDDNFPNLIQTIEFSIQNSNGWCYRKLREKINQFGKTKFETTYLCISIDTFIIKIWPPGHYSPIHHHHNAYGLIRILYGKCLIKYYPIISLNLQSNTFIEQLFEKDSITWMIPKLNQIYQMKNPNMYESCCITIQCFHYDKNELIPYEYFHYLTNDNHRIDNYQCIPDENYLNFKKIMLTESMLETMK